MTSQSSGATPEHSHGRWTGQVSRIQSVVTDDSSLHLCITDWDLCSVTTFCVRCWCLPGMPLPPEADVFIPSLLTTHSLPSEASKKNLMPPGSQEYLSASPWLSGQLRPALHREANLGPVGPPQSSTAPLPSVCSLPYWPDLGTCCHPLT